MIYKKIDSVLRGYIVDELKIQMQILSLQNALIIPANPSLGRTIKEGEYFIEDKKINNTDFINDPEFPIKSSFVKEILNNEVEVLKIADELPLHKIIVGEATTIDEINNWANKISSNLVFAGAGDFFTAILQKQFAKTERKAAGLKLCFSTFVAALLKLLMIELMN